MRTAWKGASRAEYVFAPHEWEEVLAPRLLDTADPHELVGDCFAEMPAAYDEVMRMRLADIQTWLAQDILLKADEMSMAASLELRVPFLDKEVWQVARTLPASLRVRKDATKVALHKAAAHTLPPETAAMPKLGFLTPLNEWLKQEPWKSRVTQVLNSETAARFFSCRALNRLLEDHASGRAHNMLKIWFIYCFCIWYDEFFNEA